MKVFNKLRGLKEVYWTVGFISVILFVFLLVSIGSQEDEEDAGNTMTLESLLADEEGSDLPEDDPSSIEISNEIEEYVVVVDVKGAVKNPGVFTLNSSQRVIDAINAANGLTESADAKLLNFARLLEDEMFIYVPAVGEDVGEISELSEHSVAEDDKININEANEQTLLQLSGIGPSKANEIIKYREENGPFDIVSDITKVSGIGEKTFEKIEELIDVK